MMKANKGPSGNNVVADRQWVRRVKQEEYNMIDSFGGRMQDKINAAREEQNKNHFYPQHTRMNQQPVGAAAAAQRQPEETKSRASRARDSDGLDSVSQVSVMTPKSRTDDRSSRAAQSSVSYVSKNSKSTTVSTKQKLQDLEQQL